MNNYYVYILSSYKKVLYIGVTNDLIKRVWEHKSKLVEGFTNRYNINQLVYYEETTDIYEAIKREKQLKNWRRDKKELLIKAMNPAWKDLYEELSQDPSTRLQKAQPRSG